VVENLANDMFEVGEKTIDRRRETRSIETTAEPDNCILNLSFDGADAVDVFVVTVGEATHQIWWLMVSCHPVSAGANTSNSSRNSKERCSNSAGVSVSTILKDVSTEDHLAGPLGSSTTVFSLVFGVSLAL